MDQQLLLPSQWLNAHLKTSACPKTQHSSVSFPSRETVPKSLDLSFPTNVQMMANAEGTKESAPVLEFVPQAILSAPTLPASQALTCSASATCFKTVQDICPMGQ